MSTKRVTYKQALAAAFVEGWIFIFISVTGVRGRLVEMMWVVAVRGQHCLPVLLAVRCPVRVAVRARVLGSCGP
jgi:hypothetical protein